MNRMHLYQEAITMKDRRYGNFPEAFEWRGRDYRVKIVERCWTTSNGTRFRFRVRCCEGIFNLSYHPATDRWYIENVAAD